MCLISRGLSALLMTATIFGWGCATSPSGRPRSIPVEIVEWQEKDTIGVNRVFVVKVAYRDASGAVCTTIVEMDQVTWSRVRDSSPCIVPYGHRYTVSACP
jgi:hypothetical protein